MTPVWHRGVLANLVLPVSGPVVWYVSHRDGVMSARPTTDDLVDAAQAVDGAGSLRRRGLARALVAHLASCHPDLVRFGRTTGGAQFVTLPAGWHISLSGRGPDVTIAVGRIAIGVDIEPREAAALLLDMLTPAEVDDILSTAEAYRHFEWLRRWTIKEAVAKLIGQPCQIAPESIETQVNGPCRFAARRGDYRAHGWTRITDDYVISLAQTEL